jgi:hypothetical protein
MRRESIGSRRRSSLQINHQIVAFGRLNARTGEAIRSTDRTEALMQTSYRRHDDQGRHCYSLTRRSQRLSFLIAFAQ